MEREKVIELAQEAGFKYPNEITENPEWSTYADRMYSRLLEFSRLVEQETLERAANICKDKSMKMENEAALADTQDDAISLRSSAWLISVCGNEIRNLKDNHDEE